MSDAAPAYKDLNEKQRLKLIVVSCALVDRNPLTLLRLGPMTFANVRDIFGDLMEVYETLQRPVFYEQLYNALKPYPKFMKLIFD